MGVVSLLGPSEFPTFIFGNTYFYRLNQFAGSLEVLIFLIPFHSFPNLCSVNMKTAC